MSIDGRYGSKLCLKSVNPEFKSLGGFKGSAKFRRTESISSFTGSPRASPKRGALRCPSERDGLTHSLVPLRGELRVPR